MKTLQRFIHSRLWALPIATVLFFGPIVFGLYYAGVTWKDVMWVWGGVEWIVVFLCCVIMVLCGVAVFGWVFSSKSPKSTQAQSYSEGQPYGYDTIRRSRGY